MKLFIDIAQVVVGIVLIISILLQSKGAGLGAGFGGGGETVASTRRGAEKGIFMISLVLSIAFLGLAIVRMFVI